MNKKGGKNGKDLKSGKTITKRSKTVFVINGKQCRARFTPKTDFYTRAIISQRLDGIDTCGGAGFEETGCRGFHQFADFTPCGNRHDMQSIIRSFFTHLDNRIARE